jgi:hypothetical protein
VSFEEVQERIRKTATACNVDDRVVVRFAESFLSCYSGQPYSVVPNPKSVFISALDLLDQLTKANPHELSSLTHDAEVMGQKAAQEFTAKTHEHGG